jgi:hypothetical protein
VLAPQSSLRALPALGPLAWTPVALSLLATAILVISALNGSSTSLGEWLGDTDDAVRLVTVRELLAGAPWFDTTLPRIGAPEPLLSHWSRLIDLPLAALISLLAPVIGPDRAELATRVAWPALMFFLLQLAVAREAGRRAGLLAAALAVVFAVTSMTAVAQFRPGRVDHHNAQILCAVAGLLLLARALRDPRAGWGAGVLIGLGLAVGYEAIALVVPGLALAALAAAWQPRIAPGTVRAVLAATAVMAAALVITIPPSRWLDVRCDALALNLPVLAACCATGLLGMVLAASIAARLLLLGMGAALGLALFAALEPACLAGPFGKVDPALGPIWLDQVMETKSVLWLASSHPTLALSFVAFMLAGAGAQVAIWHRRRDSSSALGASIVILAALLGCWQIKLMPYACWLAVLPLAIVCSGLRGVASMSAPVIRLAAVVLLSQASLEAAFAAVISPFQKSAGADIAAEQIGDPRRACFQSSNVRRLAALPPGLIAADIDLGPFIVAHSPHRVVAAPYHRLDKGILANEAILAGAAPEAQRQIKALGVRYLALCADGQAPRPDDTSLRGRLLRGEELPLLHPVGLGADHSIRVWRVSSTGEHAPASARR